MRLNDVACLISKNRIAGRAGIWASVYLVSKDDNQSVQECYILKAQSYGLKKGNVSTIE